ncbi:serine hydrolase [Phytoactinopolyspora halotolerans]|uniref:Serine hydrolase n=1 Tax=Phytoactinopolyspora halotolerans TaxID=1981512 RepID=A0A6L9SBH5_9ACTN|nr:serine hydrolase [Phytoactinopolyspora halotolerans]NEE01858.1 serine hydrolase [Phytoactinopolyspora halotolerans]
MSGAGWTDAVAGRLQGILRDLAASSGGTWSFTVREDGRTVATVDGDLEVRAASTIKVPLLILALQDVAAGRRALDEMLPVPAERVGGAGVLKLMPSVRALPLVEALELMIGVSDNNAANMVIDMLGVDEAAGRITALGATGTRLERRLYDVEAMRAGRDNVTTADDQALFLDLLTGPDPDVGPGPGAAPPAGRPGIEAGSGARGFVLPPELRQLALDILGRQQINDRIPAALGPDVVCRHKTGELERIRHDVGILEFDGRSVVLAALGTELDDPASRSAGSLAAATVIATAARAVVDVARSSSTVS